jgi:hypothetical protein
MKLAFLLVVLMLTGCAAKRAAHAPSKLYHFAYCDQMNPDGKHCDLWATPCGKLQCKQ